MTGSHARQWFRLRGAPFLKVITSDYFCSWSGGKDSCLALYRAVKKWGRPRCLVNMLAEGGRRSRSHGLPKAILRAQADAMGYQIQFREATWEEYEPKFVEWLREAKQAGIDNGVFGDIDLEQHRQWEQKVCQSAGMTAHLPLWGEDHDALVSEFLDAGFKAIIVTVDTEHLSESFLGREFAARTVAELRDLGIDPSAEAGEFHTLVIDGPLFSHPITYRTHGIHHVSHYAALDVTLGGTDDES